MKITNESQKTILAEENSTISDSVVLDNRYEVIGCIGKGGMGAVYKAYDLNLDNIVVAVKEMRTDIVESQNLNNAIQNFKKEAFTLEKLRHPAIPRVSNFFSYHDKWYIVMDYIEGENLGQFMIRRGKIPEKEVLNWFYQLSDVLGYLHSQRPAIVFRDLKPSNVMITPANEIKLIDFGIARHFKVDDTSGVTSYVSFGFSPPEQYGRNQADIRSDIYALGVLLHYLLTGCDPRTSNGVIVPFEQTGIHVSENLRSIIMKAVEREPNNRFQSIDEMVKAIRKKENHVLVKLCNSIKGFYKNLSMFYKRTIIAVLIAITILIGNNIKNYIYVGYKNTATVNGNVLTIEQLSLIMSLVSEEDIDKLYGFDETDIEKLKEIAKLQSRGSVEGNNDILDKMAEKYSAISEIYLLKGNNYMLSGDYKKALVEYEKALVIKSDIELAWNNKGLCEMYDGENEKAIESFKKAILISNQQPDTWNNLAVCYDSLGKHEEALNSIEEALKLNPQLSTALLNKSASLFHLSRYRESLEYAEKSLKIDPYSTVAHMNKGTALSALGEIDKAKESYEKSINLDKNNYVAWYNLGLDYDKTENFIEAVKCYDKALNIEPHYLSALNAKSKSLIALNKEQEALDCSKKAISIDSKSAEAYSNKGSALFFLGQDDKALEAFDIALSLDENEQSALRNKAQLLVNQGNYRNALKLVDKAIKADPDNYKNWITKSSITLQLGDINEAKLCLDKAKALVAGKNSEAINAMENLLNKFSENSSVLPDNVYYKLYVLIMNYTEIKYSKMDKIEYYDNVMIYPRIGLEKDTYVVFASYMVKIKDIATKIPSLTRFYCALDESGNLSLQNSPTDVESKKYINRILEEDEEIHNLKNKIDKDYFDALAMDADLKAYVDKLTSQANQNKSGE